jgi:hypothetical protein
MAPVPSAHAAVRGRDRWCDSLKRGTAEQWIKEGKQAVKMTWLSCHRFRSNEVRLWLSVIAYNLGNLWRRIALLPLRIVSQCREQARRMYYGAVFEIKSLLAMVVSVGPESKGKDFVAPAGGG